MSVLDGPLVLVDVETDGLSARGGHIIEIGVLRLDNGTVVDSFQSLIDPGLNLPPYISGLTGITDDDLRGSPSFGDIADRLWQLMDGAVFTAHNVRFDYSFVRHEFARVGKKFNPHLLCTVKLSRALFPAARGHKLQDLIDRCGLETERRHRAYDDADVMRQFLKHIDLRFPAEVVNQAIARQLKAPALPRRLSKALMDSLPERYGVYIFLDEADKPLYIGKSVNLRKRILSHFAGDHSSRLEFKISQSVANIETIECAGELESLLTESRLIKELQPLYNRQLRRYSKLTLARKSLTSDGYITLSLEDAAAIDPDSLEDILSVYTTKAKARRFLGEICKTYGICPRVLGLEKSRGPCFSHQLKKCRGACIRAHPAAEYNATLLDVFQNKRLRSWPFDSPVLISEGDQNDGYRSLVVDKWCLLADISQQPECSPIVRFHPKAFDIDSYRILRSYLETKRHLLRIRPISHESLAAMVA